MLPPSVCEVHGKKLFFRSWDNWASEGRSQHITAYHRLSQYIRACHSCHISPYLPPLQPLFTLPSPTPSLHTSCSTSPSSTRAVCPAHVPGYCARLRPPTPSSSRPLPCLHSMPTLCSGSPYTLRVPLYVLHVQRTLCVRRLGTRSWARGSTRRSLRWSCSGNTKVSCSRAGDFMTCSAPPLRPDAELAAQRNTKHAQWLQLEQAHLRACMLACRQGGVPQLRHGRGH